MVVLGGHHLEDLVQLTMARGVSGARLLVGSRFAGDKCVRWWKVDLLVKRRFAGEKCVCWRNACCWPNAFCRAKRKQQAEHELPAERELPARTRIAGRTRIAARTQFAGGTQFAGTKNQVTEFFSFGASEQDVFLSFPAALEGAEAYLLRWLASNKHLLG